ncbi:MAG: beta-ketoacyl-ACP synthase II [Rickettsiales bacterium]|jgi:3-oxoacyl-[acyl-carrier-protein] synthase II|nr:beta-ketoacyl-ACP synthase II [Rickettsiales bacterium]
MTKRVVVSGMGMITSLGNNLRDTWEGILSSKSGIKKITKFDVSGLPEGVSKVAGEISEDSGEPDAFDPVVFIDKKDIKKMDSFMWYGMAATEEAVSDANWKITDEKELIRTGVLLSSGIGGITSIQNMSLLSKEKGIKRISPFFIPQSLINLLGGNVAIKYGYQGSNFSIVSACATGNHTIGEGAEIIKRGDADVMIVGGAESCVCEVCIGGFSSMHALSTKYNNYPEKASRPWDRDRDGFVIGDGAGILVLEEYEHAKKRGAKIYAELIGYGTSCDAYHITSPHSEGTGAKMAMKIALQKAQLCPENIRYINAHGTSTLAGDILEFNAVKNIFSSCLDGLYMSSTKSSTGHLLGAAGAIEAIFSIKALQDGILPPTLNLDNVDEQCSGIDLVPNFPKEVSLDYVLSDSFGFGGTNACLIFKKL